MKDRLRVLPMKMLAAFCLVMGGIPSSILLGRLFLSDAPHLWALLPLLSWAWACVGYLLPNKGRLPFALLGCGLLAAWGAAFQLPLGAVRLLPLIPCIAALLALPPAWHRPAWDEWPVGAWFGGIILHLFGQLVSGWPMFEGVGPWLLPCFAVYAFLYVLCQNRRSLIDGMHGAGKAPAAIRRRNTVLSAVFFLIALGASCWRQLAVWVGAAWDFIRDGIIAVVAFLMRLLPEQGASPGGGGGDMGGLLGAGEETEPSTLALIMETVFKVLALIVLLILIFFALKALWKGCRKLWKRFMAYLNRYAADSGEDYIRNGKHRELGRAHPDHPGSGARRVPPGKARALGKPERAGAGAVPVPAIPAPQARSQKQNGPGSPGRRKSLHPEPGPGLYRPVRTGPVQRTGDFRGRSGEWTL